MEIHFNPKAEVVFTIYDESGQKVGRVKKVRAGEIGVVKITKDMIDFHVRNNGDKPKRKFEIGPPVG